VIFEPDGSHHTSGQIMLCKKIEGFWPACEKTEGGPEI